MATTEAPPVETFDGTAGNGTLAAKLARIMGSLERLGHDGQVTGTGGYGYTSADTISDTIRPLLAAEGIVLLPSKVEITEQRIDEIDKGSYTQTRYTVSLRAEWTLTDGLDTLHLESVGTGVDYSGKAANAATTFARMNAIKAAFHLSTGDDPEGAQGSHGGGQQSSGQRATGTGELPTVFEADGITGRVGVMANGRIGVAFKAEEYAAFEKIKDAVKAIPGRSYDADSKTWSVPADKAGLAVALGRHVGLVIADDLAARFPAEPAPQSAPAQGDLPVGGGAEQRATVNDPDDDDIPF